MVIFSFLAQKSIFGAFLKIVGWWTQPEKLENKTLPDECSIYSQEYMFQISAKNIQNCASQLNARNQK